MLSVALIECPNSPRVEPALPLSYEVLYICFIFPESHNILFGLSCVQKQVVICAKHYYCYYFL